jgi:dihydrodipicolinate synthase/N-acetylneuraminate lyase
MASHHPHPHCRYDVVYGRDDAMLGALALGATGVIGNQFLFAAGLFARLRAAFERGDLAAARLEQGRSCDCELPPLQMQRATTHAPFFSYASIQRSA